MCLEMGGGGARARAAFASVASFTAALRKDADRRMDLGQAATAMIGSRFTDAESLVGGRKTGGVEPS